MNGYALYKITYYTLPDCEGLLDYTVYTDEEDTAIEEFLDAMTGVPNFFPVIVRVGKEVTK